MKALPFSAPVLSWAVPPPASGPVPRTISKCENIPLGFLLSQYIRRPWATGAPAGISGLRSSRDIAEAVDPPPPVPGTGVVPPVPAGDAPAAPDVPPGPPPPAVADLSVLAEVQEAATSRSASAGCKGCRTIFLKSGLEQRPGLSSVRP